MPKVREKVAVEIDFSMYCAKCNTGICNNTTYIRDSENTFAVYCPRCDRELEDALATIESLNDEIVDLKKQLEENK